MTLLNIINAVFPGNEFFINKYENVLSYLDVYGLQTAMRKSAFLSQVGHESQGFRFVEENLNYSSNGLLTTFSKYFNENEALDYHRKPEKIANKVYANRMGNGSEDSGDGWRYRGRGLIQLTGKTNYEKFGDFAGVDVIGNPDFLLTPDGAMYSAIWFWDTNGCNKFADKGDITGLTKRINGGINGLEHRKELYNKFLPLMKEYIANLSIGDDTLPPIKHYTVEQEPIVIGINDPLPGYAGAEVVPVIRETLPDITNKTNE